MSQAETRLKSIAVDVPDDFSFSMVRGGDGWVEKLGVRSRELGLRTASGGRMSANQFRCLKAQVQPEAFSWRIADSTFHLIYVIAGRGVLELGSGERRPLLPGTVVQLPQHPKYRLLDTEHAFEFIEVVVHDKAASGGSPASLIASELHAVDEGPQSYVRGEGIRHYFAYRDLKSKEHSDGKIHIQTFKAVEIMPGGTGWHKHTNMCQFFFVLDGEAGFCVPGLDSRICTGDAVCMPRGRPHNVPSYTGKYQVLEMCIPGEFDTIPVDAPAGQA